MVDIHRLMEKCHCADRGCQVQIFRDDSPYVAPGLTVKHSTTVNGTVHTSVRFIDDFLMKHAKYPEGFDWLIETGFNVCHDVADGKPVQDEWR